MISGVWKGPKSLDQLQSGSKRHIVGGGSLGPYATFWSREPKNFVRHLGFWRPFWIFAPVIDFFPYKCAQNFIESMYGLQNASYIA